MNYQWIEITLKHGGNCIECSEYIKKDERALWMSGLGIKHIECPTDIHEDNSELVIIDEGDKEKLGWNNDRTANI